MDIKELSKLIDSKVLFITPDGEFEGIMKMLRVQAEIVIFEHVYLLPGYEYMGTTHVTFPEILSCKCLVPAQEVMDNSKFESHLKLLIPGFEKSARIDDSIDTETSEKYITEDLPENLQDECPKDFCIIDSFSEAFCEAIDHLSHSNTLGVSFQGCKISRFGTLSWVCISSATRAFLFDIDQLGKDAFDKGLREIFQDEDIEKIVHDCRQVADCLFNKFETELNNLFDTQVADYLINMQMYSGDDVFRYVSSLDSCLAKYLELPLRLLHNRNKLLSVTEEKKFFEIRPIGKKLVNVLLKSAIFLLPLKEAQEHLMLSPFQLAVDLHLNSLRRADDSQAFREPSSFTQTAPSYLLECLESIRFQNVSDTEDDYVTKFKNTPHGQKVWHHRMLVTEGLLDDGVDEDKWVVFLEVALIYLLIFNCMILPLRNIEFF